MKGTGKIGTPYLMFAIREVPQSSTGFSPFELLYGRQPRGVLDIAKELWESQGSPETNIIDHVLGMRDRIKEVSPIVREHLEKAQESQKVSYNKQAQVRTFLPRERVMLLVPTPDSKLYARWQGPYEVIEAVGLLNYKIRQPDRRKPEQIYHVNLLKPWRDREAALLAGSDDFSAV